MLRKCFCARLREVGKILLRLLLMKEVALQVTMKRFLFIYFKFDDLDEDYMEDTIQ